MRRSAGGRAQHPGGDSGTGIVDGPGQVNVDLSISKLTSLRGPREGSNLEFRAEFFNALNHPQFANPDAIFRHPRLASLLVPQSMPVSGNWGLS